MHVSTHRDSVPVPLECVHMRVGLDVPNMNNSVLATTRLNVERQIKDRQLTVNKQCTQCIGEVLLKEAVSVTI